MFNILVVDDEEIEREGIKFLIDKHNVELNVAEAANGVKALEYLKNNQVDILFTDIKMPFMDGLDLSHEAKKINPKLKIILFSAYGEFDYAKRAIKNDTFSYLLKPIEINEFIDVIHKVIDICKKEDEEEKKKGEIIDSYKKILVYEKEKILLDLINGTEIDDRFIAGMDLVSMDFRGKYTNMLLIYFQERFFDSNNDEFLKVIKLPLQSDYEYLNLNEYQSIIFYTFPDKEPERETLNTMGSNIITSISEVFSVKPCLIFGQAVMGLENFSKEYKAMERKSDLKFFYEEGTIFFTSDTNIPDTPRYDSQGGIINLIMEGSEEKQNHNNDETNKTVIRKVIDIIEKEYMNSISLEYIADKVYLSPSYLSYLFKKEVDQNLLKFITSIRMKKAKELLDDTNMRIVEIGEKVGYSNLSYFCMTFRNNYGMTPAKYRERVK